MQKEMNTISSSTKSFLAVSNDILYYAMDDKQWYYTTNTSCGLSHLGLVGQSLLRLNSPLPVDITRVSLGA